MFGCLKMIFITFLILLLLVIDTMKRRSLTTYTCFWKMED